MTLPPSVRFLAAFAIALACATSLLADCTPVADWLKLPAGRPQLGNIVSCEW